MSQRSAWPEPADPDAALRLIERFGDSGAPERAVAATPDGQRMLRAIGGGSPYLSDLAVREHETAVACMQAGPDAALIQVQAALDALDPAASRATLAAELRAAKRRTALLCAIADIGGLWSLARVTGVLAGLAETALRKAIDHLLLASAVADELTLPDPATPGNGSGLIVLGMGKLGAGELNYSSDIDLILLFDPAAQRNRDGLGATFTRLARNLVAILEARDANGYVFRTDLRLRPDPEATPPVVALPAALAYYESMGQNWERAAMIKARPLAGDIRLGRDFLQQIRPFVWRRGLDFAAIADIHAMKRRINQHKGLGTGGAIAGLDVKLGRGGIREIEFAAQTLQLVWGGRDPSLRQPTTLGALRGLVRAGKLGRRTAAELTVAYRALRSVEHRLQMVADRQTHAIPSKPDELERFAVFMGCRDAAQFTEWLERHLARVRAGYAAVFENVPEPPPGVATLDLSGIDDPPATVAALRSIGFSNTSAIIAALRGWRSGRLRALRSARSRELMDQVLPSLLEALGGQSDPDAAFIRFDQMLQRLPAGVQILSMLQRNPALLHRVATVLGAAPSLAEHLSTVPTALEGLLAPDTLDPAPRQTLARRLQDARALEDVIAITRAMVRAEEFRLCVGQMEGWLDVDAAGLARTALADAALAALLDAVLRDHAARYGSVPGGDLAVVALGKAGSREMMAGSDLDLMLIYNHPPDVAESEGAHQAAGQHLVHPRRPRLRRRTDRPGRRRAALRRRHAPAAVRQQRPGRRLAGGVPPLSRAGRLDVGADGADPRARRRRRPGHRRRGRARPSPKRWRTSRTRPRRRPTPPGCASRMLRDTPPTGPWDVKLRPGGIIEVEFIAQTLLLVAGVAPGQQRTLDALRHLAAIGALPAPEADGLVRADRLWRTIQSMLRILVGRTTDALPEAAAAALLRAIDPALDLPALRARMDATAADVRAAFQSLVGDIA